MTEQIIKFISNSAIKKVENEKPVPIIKTLPQWYKNADKYMSHDNDKYSTFKNCVPFFDAMTSGYTFVTPCDIDFFIENNTIKHKVLDPNFEFFIETRIPIEQFYSPDGYHLEHFAWFPEWYPVLPEGYSLLCTMPLNRYELPFLTTSGIIDSDKIKVAGRIPFFLKQGFTGVIKAGTPIAQLIPIKREKWISEYEYPSHGKSLFDKLKNIKKYRESKKNEYRNNDWVKKIYE